MDVMKLSNSTRFIFTKLKETEKVQKQTHTTFRIAMPNRIKRHKGKSFLCRILCGTVQIRNLQSQFPFE